MSDVTTAITTACASQTRNDDYLGTTSGSDLRPGPEPRKRRHSFFIPRRRSIIGHIMDGEDGLLLKVDLFLSELERRLDFIENYVDLGRDSSISRAFSTLHAVRTRCSHASEEVIGAGRRRLQIMVETLEARYQGTLEAAESLNEKAHVGVDLLENLLTDFETRAHKLREQGLANATTAAEAFIDEGCRVAHEGFERHHTRQGGTPDLL